MPVIPEGYGQINYRFRGGGLPTGAEVTMGFFNTESETDPLVLAEAADAAFAPVVAEMTTVIGVEFTRVKLGPNEFGLAADFPSALEGSDPDNVVPPSCSMLVKKITGFGGRTGRGRIYLPGFSEEDLDAAGIWAGALVSDVQAAIVSWTTDLDAAGMTPTLLHGPDSPITIPSTLVNMVVDTRAATQRRRLRR